MSLQAYRSYSSNRIHPRVSPLRGYVDAAVETRAIESTEYQAELLAQRLAIPPEACKAIAGSVVLVLMVWVSQLG